VGHWLKKKLGIKFLNDIRGFWADERVDGGMWNIKNPVYKFIYHFFKRKEDEFIVDADYNTCLTVAARAEIHTWQQLPNQPIPIEVIPCCADLGLFNPDNITPAIQHQWRTTLNIREGDIIISYLGSIGGWYLTGEMMRFCKLLSEKIPRAKFLFISPHLHDVIAAAAEKVGLSADKLVVHHGKRHEVPALLSLSNFAVFFIKPCYSKISSSPTKHGEIMAMGIPVITNGGVGDVKEIVTKYKAGYVVDDFTNVSFNAVINQLVLAPAFDKGAIRLAAKECYALDNAVASYRKVYMTIFE